jgi:hypothetical protein
VTAAEHDFSDALFAEFLVAALQAVVADVEEQIPQPGWFLEQGTIGDPLDQPATGIANGVFCLHNADSFPGRATAAGFFTITRAEPDRLNADST